MDLSGLTAVDPAPGFQNSGSSGADLDRDAFMQLLVAQLTNQDPLEPVNNEDFTAQLAQFSSLEQLESMNETLATLTLLQQGNALLSQLSESSALIGQQVAWSDPELGFSGEGTVESIELIEGITYLAIGENKVPLAYVTEVQGAGSSDDVEPTEPETSDDESADDES